MKRSLVSVLQDLGLLAGAALFVFGWYLVYRPLAAILGGLFLAAGCWFAAYGRERKEVLDRIRGGRA